MTKIKGLLQSRTFWVSVAMIIVVIGQPLYEYIINNVWTAIPIKQTIVLILGGAAMVIRTIQSNSKQFPWAVPVLAILAIILSVIDVISTGLAMNQPFFQMLVGVCMLIIPKTATTAIDGFVKPKE